MQDDYCTNHALIPLLEFPHCRLDFLANHKDRFFPSHPRILAMLIVNITERDIGGIALEKAEIGRTRYSGRQVEMEISLPTFLLAVQGTVPEASLVALPHMII